MTDCNRHQNQGAVTSSASDGREIHRGMCRSSSTNTASRNAIPSSVSWIGSSDGWKPCVKWKVTAFIAGPRGGYSWCG